MILDVHLSKLKPVVEVVIIVGELEKGSVEDDSLVK